MKCEKCGMELTTVFVDEFQRDGRDCYIEYPICECEERAVYFDSDANWAGYELSDEERLETIKCPYCNRFPFKKEEIQVHEIVRVVCFKEGN